MRRLVALQRQRVDDPSRQPPPPRQRPPAPVAAVLGIGAVPSHHAEERAYRQAEEHHGGDEHVQRFQLGLVLLDPVLGSLLVLQPRVGGEDVESPQSNDLGDGLESSSPDVHAAAIVYDGGVFEPVGDAGSGGVVFGRGSPVR
mmetsp:Transcript_4619/g.8610  ORF Transcript_4619/g.8610 Transcript_4619/m.8610 type:complete len:143 (-) Transcript_4619:82-510(-)